MRGLKVWLPVLMAVVLAAGFALASRNSSGTYSLPSGNPVVTRTAISSSWANSTLGDIGNELTNSLDRSGRGAMTGQFQAASGTVSAPGITWALETNSGLYRIGAKDFGMAFNGSKNIEFNGATSGSQAFVAITSPNTSASAPGLTVTGSSFASSGSSAIVGSGGGGNQNGVTGTGASGGTGTGINGNGGTGGGFGGRFSNGVAATGGTRQTAVSVTNGDIAMGGVNPTSTTALSNAITPASYAKAWGYIHTDGAGTGTGHCFVDDGINIASCSAGTQYIIVTLAGGSFANNNYAVNATSITSGAKCDGVTNACFIQVAVIDGSSFKLYVQEAFSSAGGVDNSANAVALNFSVFGKQ